MLKYLVPYYEEMETWMVVLTVADKILFALFFISVAYLAFFAFLSMFSESKRYTAARRQHRFAIIFPYSKGHSGLETSLASLDALDYPRELYRIIVACPDCCNEGDPPREDITVVRPDAERFSKREAIRAAVGSLEERSYDVVVVLDSGNTVDPGFLNELNDAYASGCMAIQAHRKANTPPSDIALLGAASQEINNGIFRRGHVRLGLSSALAGTGMAFDFDWIKQHIESAKGDDLEKQLEIMLLEQRIFIEYLNRVYVYEDKAVSPVEFYHERKQWMVARMENLRRAITRLPSALFSGNFDYCDKLFQWIIPSRTILLGMLTLITLGMTLAAWPMSLKWWGLLFLLILTFSMAMPDFMIDARFVRAVKTMPLIFMLTLFNVFRRRVLKTDKP